MLLATSLLDLELILVPSSPRRRLRQLSQLLLALSHFNGGQAVGRVLQSCRHVSILTKSDLLL